MNLLKQICMVLLALSVSPLSEAAEYTIKGDIRYRYENRDSEDTNISDKSRERIRARIGVYGDATETISFGTRIATGGTGVTSTNEDLDGSAANKSIGLDLAYITIDSLLFEGVDTTLGKMKQPWKSVSDLIYDSDITPEGIAINSTEGNVSYHVGHFVLSEAHDKEPNKDTNLVTLQITYKLDNGLLLGAGYHEISDLIDDGIADDFYKSREAKDNKGTNTQNEFELTEFFASYKIKSTPLPLSLFANYVENGAVDADNTAYMFGAKTKQGAWSFAYNYRDIEINAIYDEWADSDFHDGGTGGDGHKYKVKYALRDNLSLGATYFDTETEAGKEVNTLQVDLVAKF